MSEYIEQRAMYLSLVPEDCEIRIDGQGPWLKPHEWAPRFSQLGARAVVDARRRDPHEVDAENRLKIAYEWLIDFSIRAKEIHASGDTEAAWVLINTLIQYGKDLRNPSKRQARRIAEELYGLECLREWLEPPQGGEK